MSEKQFRVQQVDHIELYVPDQYEAAQWYKQIFGLEIMPDFEFWAGGGGPLMLSSDGGSTKIALFNGEAPGFRPVTGFQRVAFRVDGPGFFDFLNRLQAQPVYDHSGRPVNTLKISDHTKAYSVYFCDPYGNPYEITTYDYDYVSAQVTRRESVVAD
jgi:catechol 2,3-dioxygenase-like lactoylglutathione lyase family enzyme